MKLVRFANIAYNTPCVVAVDMSKEVQIYKRTVCDSKEVQFYIVSAFYDGEPVQLEVISFVYNQLVKGYEESSSNMVYVFAHAVAGVYKFMNHREYSRLVRYDIVSKKQYIELSKDYGFKIYSEDKDWIVFERVIENLSSLLISRVGVKDSGSRVFSYSDIECVIVSEEKYVRVEEGSGIKGSKLKVSAFMDLLNSLLILRLGRADKECRVFSYSDIVNILELSR